MNTSDGPNYWYDEKVFTLKSSDPDIWITYYLAEYRLNNPPRFVLHIDDRDIGFSISEEPVRIKLVEDEASGLPILEFGYFGIQVSGCRGYESRKTKTNTDKFESREQQDRAINFIRNGLPYFSGGNFPGEKRTGLIAAIVRFTPELEKKFDAGDFIE